MSDKVYMTTKEQCQAAIDLRGGVCSSCGRTPVPIETVDNLDHPTFWAGCMHGTEGDGNYTAGVSVEIFEMAKKLVLHGERAYSHMCKTDYTKPEMREHWLRSQISGMCSHLLTIEWLKTNNAKLTEEEFLSDMWW